jgi:DNA-binding response OmpR family regulator
MKILMIEDEKYIAEAVEQVLKKNHYAVDLAFDGEYGLYCGLSDIYDTIILDIMLPKMNGIDVLKQLRKEKIGTPVLMLTAKGQLSDKVEGLDSGADDYLPKPFEMDELLARLRALGRRKSELLNDGLLNLGDIKLNPHSLLLSCGGNEVKLTLKEAGMLELLIMRKNMVSSKDLMIEKLWGYDSDAEDSHVENHVSLLRKKLKQVNSTHSIMTIRGAGYMIKAERAGE